MGTFLRGRFPITNEPSFVQGAGRILVAPSTVAMPDGIEDILQLGNPTSVATIYDPISPWYDIGYTKTGINVTRNNAEEEFTVDQIRSSIKRRPSTWDMSVGTQLAEATLETFALAWELPHTYTGTGASTTEAATIASVNKTAVVGPPAIAARIEKQIGLGAPSSYIERKVAVVFQFPSGLIRAWVFRRCTRAPQEAGFTLNSTGEQVSLPIRFNCLADPDQPVDNQFGFMFEGMPNA